MLKCNDPIAVFDSGVGGVSVLRELVRLMPNEDYIYFGDSRNAPYGTKTAREVRALSLNNAEMLLSLGAKAVVVACNTATSAAITTLREHWPDVPIIGMEPAVKPAVTRSGAHRVLVMATPMTLRRRKFQKLMRQYGGMAELVPLPCPGLVELIEAGCTDSEGIKKYLRAALEPQLELGVDGIVLGCTHYPFVADEIRAIASGAEIFDGSLGTAQQTRRRLAEAGLLCTRAETGEVQFYNSLPEKTALCKKLLGR